MKKTLHILSLLSLFFSKIQAQSFTTGKNAVMEKTPREALTTLLGTTHTTVQTAIEYFDGLGRPIQSLVYKANPTATKDIIASTTQYDALGRAYKSMLATPSDVSGGIYKPTAQALAVGFYDNDTYPFTETIFEASPLNRPKQQFGAGQAWRSGTGHSVGMQYLTAGTEVLHFEIRSTGTIEKVGVYADNSLFCNRTISERGFKTNEYKDHLGRVVAKSQELATGELAVTLYLYDDLNRLRYVIPPASYQTLNTLPNFTENSTIFKEGIYAYTYDTRGRLIEKHIPGAGWTRYVYDKNDRIVMESDDKDNEAGYWKFTKYDALSRPIMTGLVYDIGTIPRQTIQTAFDGHNANTYEVIGETLLGYTNSSFPVDYKPKELGVRTVTYYDDYNWQTNANYTFQSATAFHSQASAKTLVTGKLIRNLITNTWQKMVMYYDYKGRLIQDYHLTNRNNQIAHNYQYRFNGELLTTKIEKRNTSNTILSTKILSYEYDHLSRKTKFKYSLNGNEHTIAAYEYDEIGRMKTKIFSPSNAIGSSQNGNWTATSTWQGGSIPTISDNVRINTGHMVTIPRGQSVSAGSLFDAGNLQNFGTLYLGSTTSSLSVGSLQVLNYKYHIRGGLKGINLDANNNLTNSLFSYKLAYEDDGTYYDGNIRNQYWKSSVDGIQRAYEYTYDGASRLDTATYASTKAGENYALNSVSYDKNGNITALNRNGATTANYSSFGNVDNLTYTYQSNSNKVLKITDATTGNTDLGDFRDNTNTDNDYDYWIDGSLKKDKNKKITLITYNYLKLPAVITFDNTRTITTEYDAAGTKLKKIDSNGEVTDYEEDDIYVNNNLYQISHQEGRIANGIYEYNITDHLGNLRVSFRDSSGIAVPLQSIFYDPWGLAMKGMQVTRNPVNFNNFQYNSKEIDLGTGYIDLGNRMINPTIGRALSQDRFSGDYKSYSPYNHALNNPLIHVDVNGDSIINVQIHDESGFIHGETSLFIDHTLYGALTELLDYASSNGINIHINSSFRTNKKQASKNFRKAGTTPAKPGRSMHNAGLAVDFNLYEGNDFSKGTIKGNKTVSNDNDFISEAKDDGWRWGGNFKKKDPVHIDKRSSNFINIRDENQEQMHGESEVSNNLEYVKRVENVTTTTNGIDPTKPIEKSVFFNERTFINNLSNQKPIPFKQ